MNKSHRYKTNLIWTGNTGSGTSSYKAYERSFEVIIEGKPLFPGSADTVFRGDSTKYNPEDLLLMSISSCHMLWYLHLCADNGIIVTNYSDSAFGIMEIEASGGGKFTEAKLNPKVTITNQSRALEAIALHEAAHQKCFIANSVNFKIRIEPTINN